MRTSLAGRRGGLGLAAALLLATPAAAITQPGTLASAAEDVDFYRVTCSNDGSGNPASLMTQVLDASPAAAPLVSVQSQKGFLAINTTDDVDGDGSASPAAFVNGGTGSYDVFVDKSQAGAESYLLTVQCMTGSFGTGVPTGTALTAISTGPSDVPALSRFGLVALAAGVALLGAAALRRRRAAALAVLLVAATGGRDALAHTQGGSLGGAASATDFYQVTCSQDPPPSPVPALLFLQVLDTSSAPNPENPALVAVQGQKGSLAANSTDPAGGDASPSPAITLSGGAGVYDVLVYKTGTGSDGYTLIFHCMTADLADHTPTSITNRQDQ
jgi:hypothetical protein